jgi:saccharopine dehydrogenase-like NADP-dependent oxidoreductase
LKRLGLLSDETLQGLDFPVSPHQFMVKLLEPQLQYGNDEKDVVAMYNVFSGVKDGRSKTIQTSLVIERDLTSGLYGMSLGVGFPASIVAQMIVSGEIKKTGVLNPALDVPYAPFMAQLEKRGIVVHETEAFD